MTHLAECYLHIEAEGSHVTRRESWRLACGATEGEGVEDPEGVTCPECKERESRR